MKTALAMIVFLMTCTSAFGDCQTEMDKAVETFWDAVFKVSRIEKNHSLQERQILCQKAADRLLRVARELGIPTGELEEILREYLDHMESTREPPQGWNPSDRRGNLLMFSEMAKQRVRMDLALVSYGRRHCFQEAR